jgi:hypothetical protein
MLLAANFLPTQGLGFSNSMEADYGKHDLD